MATCSFSLVLISLGLFTIQFVFYDSIIDPVLIPRFLFLSILLFLLVLSAITQAIRFPSDMSHSIVHRAVFTMGFGFLGICSISLIGHGNNPDGLFELNKIFLLFVFLYITTQAIINSKNGIEVIAKSITLSSLVLSIIGIIQYLDWGFLWMPGQIVPYGTMANKNLFATVLFLASPFIIYGIMQPKWGWRKLFILTICVVWCNIIIAQTRSVWAAICISAIVWIVLRHIVVRKERLSQVVVQSSIKYFKISIILVVVTIVSINLIKYKHPDQSLTRRLTSLTDMGHESIGERIDLWKRTLQMIGDNGLLGSGLGNWKIMIPLYGTENTRSESGIVHFQRPHNDYLWVLAETGIFGLLLYLSIFGVTIGYALRLVMSPLISDQKYFISLMVFGLVGYLTISFFSYPKERIVHSIFVMLMISTILSIYEKTFPSYKIVQQRAQYLLFGPLLLLVSFSSVFGYARLQSESHVRNALEAKNLKNWDLVISEIDLAESCSYTFDPMATPLKWYRGVANYSLNKVAEASEDFKEAKKKHPYHLHVLNNLGTCQELLGDHASAIENYEQVLAISPNYEEALINLSVVLFNGQRYEEAYEKLLRCDTSRFNPVLSSFIDKVENELGTKRREKI